MLLLLRDLADTPRLWDLDFVLRNLIFFLNIFLKNKNYKKDYINPCTETMLQVDLKTQIVDLVR